MNQSLLNLLPGMNMYVCSSMPTNSILLLNPKYKTMRISHADGSTTILHELDVEATAKASVLIDNIAINCKNEA